MHKKVYGREAPSPQQFYCTPRQQSDGIAQMVVDAVAQYNEMEPQLRLFRRQENNERFIKEAEEEATKVFLDGILDIVQSVK